MTIIKLEKVNGIHPLERQSGRKGNWKGVGWREVPDNLVSAAWAACGYCDLVWDGESLVGIVPTQRPPEPEPAPTPGEDMDALLVDHEYRLTLLELGIWEEV